MSAQLSPSLAKKRIQSPTLLYSLCAQISGQFWDIKSSFPEETLNFQDKFSQGISYEQFVDLSARFHIWFDDIKEMQPGEASLDLELKDSPIIGEIERLLSLLSRLLTDLAAILSGARTQLTWSFNEDLSAEHDDTDIDTSEPGDENQSLEEDSHKWHTECEQLQVTLDNTVRSLLKSSVIMKKTSRKAKFAESSMKYQDELFSAEVISEFLPNAKSNELLIKLSKASNQRLHWLICNLLQEDETVNSNSTHGDGSIKSQLEQNKSKESKYKKIMLQSRHLNFPPIIAEMKQDLIPCLPKGATLRRAFRCDLCQKFITVDSMVAWKEHVHSDLSSYVCTFEHCVHPPFESRAQWFDHEMDIHRREWNCLICSVQCKTPKEMEDHMSQQHDIEVGGGKFSAAIEAASQPVRRIPATACPLCDCVERSTREVGARGSDYEYPTCEDQGCVSLEKFRDHLGLHLEQLALLVLPSDHDVLVPRSDRLVQTSEDSESLRWLPAEGDFPPLSPPLSPSTTITPSNHQLYSVSSLARVDDERPDFHLTHTMVDDKKLLRHTPPIFKSTGQASEDQGEYRFDSSTMNMDLTPSPLPPKMAAKPRSTLKHNIADDKNQLLLTPTNSTSISKSPDVQGEDSFDMYSIKKDPDLNYPFEFPSISDPQPTHAFKYASTLDFEPSSPLKTVIADDKKLDLPKASASSSSGRSLEDNYVVTSVETDPTTVGESERVSALKHKDEDDKKRRPSFEASPADYKRRSLARKRKIVVGPSSTKTTSNGYWK